VQAQLVNDSGLIPAKTLIQGRPGTGRWRAGRRKDLSVDDI
jgi:hypothetical protein